MKYSLLILLLFSNTASSCFMVCSDLEDYVASSKYVFYATDVRVNFLGQNPDEGEPMTDVNFEVKKTWKGDWGNSTLITKDNKYSCEGYDFKEDKEYIMTIIDEEQISFCDIHEFSKELESKLDVLFQQEPSNK